MNIFGGSGGSASKHLDDRLIKREKLEYGTVLQDGNKVVYWWMNNTPILMNQIWKKVSSVYKNASFPQPLDLYSIRETYNSVELFAALVNESRSRNEGSNGPQSICNGRKLMSLMTNQSFRFLSGSVNVRSDGSRYADLLLYTFNQTDRKMHRTAWYDSSADQYVWNTRRDENFWLARVPDVPECGYTGLEAPCQQSGNEIFTWNSKDSSAELFSKNCIFTC